MRITGGAHRSRLLRAPRGDRTRPTSDRVREALFDSLMAERDLSGDRVLDLYAGTGALGLEAVSRGAAHATLVENARGALEAIAANVESLGLGQSVRVVSLPVERAAGALATGAPYDLILADPPYDLVASGVALRALRDLVGRSLLARDAVVVLEHARADEAPPVEGLSPTRTRRYGDTSLSFYRRGDQGD
jgi:16S rRNA (guanine966-N2)-methyltransferase